MLISFNLILYAPVLAPVHYSDAFNYPDVRYSGVSLYIANRFLRQSKEGKGYHQMQSTVSKEDVHGSGVPWLRLTFVAITISMTLAWHKAKKEQFKRDLRRQTSTLVTRIDNPWLLLATLPLYYPVQDLKMTPLLQFTPVNFLKSTPIPLLTPVYQF